MKTPRFEIFEGKNNEFFFRLKAKNGKIILQSEGYTQKHNCEKGIGAVVFNSQTDFLHELNGYWTSETLYCTNPSHFYFTLESVNGEKLGKSETYTTKAGAKKGIEAVRRCAPIADIVDLTGEI